MNFRVQKNFSVNYDLIDRLFNKSDDEVKIELIKCLPYCNEETITLKYFNLILSNEITNENLLIETLKALQVRKWDSGLLNENKISTHLKKLISSKRKNFIVNETIKTYAHLFDIDDLRSDSLLLKNLSDINVIQFLVIAKKDLKLSTLLKNYNNIKVAKQKLIALEILIGLNKEFSSDTNYIHFVLNELKSDNPAIISIVADGIDSNFISNHSEELKEITSYQAIRFKDNSDFIEAEISLINLSDKISNEFLKELINKLSDTKLYSLRKFLNRLDNSIGLTEKNINHLSHFIEEAFSFSGAIIKTNKGIITINFKPELAPITVGNFVHLAKKNFYDGIIFHRVVPGFVIQAGDPTGTGWGGPGYEIISEFSPEEFKTGAAGIASAGKDTEGSQFFIMQGYYPHLNSRYTLFAEIVSGLDVVMKISEDDQIISVELLQ
ncbi:MAG: peptidylprolyl isomerase [Ignavibacterium sp.]